MPVPGTPLREPAPSRRLNNPVGLDRPNYPENQWWVAATSDELGSLPMQRWILGLPVLLYRRADGRAVALDDRCPHRWAPLSLGRVEGDDIAAVITGYASDRTVSARGFRRKTRSRLPRRCEATPSRNARPSSGYGLVTRRKLMARSRRPTSPGRRTGRG